MQVIISSLWQLLLRGLAGILSIECLLLAVILLFFACWWHWLNANRKRAHRAKLLFSWIIVIIIITMTLAIISTY